MLVTHVLHRLQPRLRCSRDGLPQEDTEAEHPTGGGEGAQGGGGEGEEGGGRRGTRERDRAQERERSRTVTSTLHPLRAAVV